MKTIVFEKHTKDVDGLLTELRRELGPVVSVASDPYRTYIYVEDDSALDPEPTVKRWEDVPEVRVESTNRVGPEGIPVAWADGKDTHTLIIQKTTGYGDVIPDSTKIVITTASKVPLSKRKFRLKEGLASITFGPTTEPELVSLTVVDAWKKMQAVPVRVQFMAPPPDAEIAPVMAEDQAPGDAEEPAPPPEPAKKESRSSLWARLRKILGF